LRRACCSVSFRAQRVTVSLRIRHPQNRFCGAITEPDFQLQVGRPLSFNDFEDLPFCSLTYNNANPTYTQTYTIQGVARTQIVTF